MAKDFTGMNTGARVSNAMEKATAKAGQQATANPEEVAERQSQARTQGRLGCKMPRINMAFTPENHQFIKVMAKVTGNTMTDFANIVIQRYREEHPEVYEKAKDIINSL